MHAMFLLMMLAYLCGNSYIFFRAMQLFTDCALWWRILFSILYWLVVFSLPISMFMRNADLPYIVCQCLYKTGAAWLVFTFYMVLFLLLTDLLRIWLPLSRSGFWIALVVTMGLLIYGNYTYHHPQINRIPLTLGKDSLLNEMKVVAVSDVHLGYATGKRQMQHYVEMINAENPDLILIVGDLIDNSVLPLRSRHLEEELSALKAPMGIYMVPGNHEYISGINECTDFLKQTPVCLLRDSVVTLSNGVQLVGRDDRSNRQRMSLNRLMKKVDGEKPMIMLEHQPYGIGQKDSLSIDLQIYGHTHHGQVWPVSLLTDYLYEQSHGFRRWSHSNVYVSSGLSLWGPPFRIGTQSDMAVFSIK